MSINLVKSFPNGNIIKICWPEEAVSISTKTVSIGGNTINELLRTHNILPDIEAFGIVYSLNPEIKKLSQLEVAQIRLPTIQGGETLKQLFGDGFQVLLTSDKGLKKQFSEEVARLLGLHGQFKSLESNKFFDSDTKARILNELGSALSILRGINIRIVQRAGRPIPKEVLEQLTDEIQSLNSSLSHALSFEQRVGKAELAQTTAVKKDLDIKVKAFTETADGPTPARWPGAVVTVRTFKEGKEIRDLRVYYVAEANCEKIEKARPFGKLSSPTDLWLPDADYCLWAARDPDRSPVSNKPLHIVRQSQGAAEVHLTILP
jgi:hypothetical protein